MKYLKTTRDGRYRDRIYFEVIDDFGTPGIIEFQILNIKTIKPFVFVENFKSTWNFLKKFYAVGGEFETFLSKNSVSSYSPYISSGIRSHIASLENELSCEERLYLEVI